jgi:ribosomal protein L22
MTQNAAGSSNGGSSPEESLTQEQMQKILRIGEQASQLLNNPVYNMAYQQLLNVKFQEWMSSSPKEQAKREGLYTQAKGLVEVTELLASAVEDAQRVQQDLNMQNDPLRQQQEYADQQGFGLNFQ